MLSRFLALVILIVLVVAGLYYWRVRPERAPEINTPALDEVGQKFKDTKTTGSVKTALELSRTLDPYRIEVHTENDVVTLRGEVPSEEVKAAVERVAASVPDVRQVVNQIRVNAALAEKASASTQRSVGESLDDNAVLMKLKLAFSLNRELKGTDIDVRVYRRDVTVAGRVSSAAQRDLAVAIARDTEGVESVKDEIQVGGSGPAPVAEAPPAGDPRLLAERALAANTDLSSYRLRVEQRGERLVLTGTVRSAAEKDLAGALARAAAPGATIDNALEVKP
jgi:osmotically-inducible protein OsmY